MPPIKKPLNKKNKSTPTAPRILKIKITGCSDSIDKKYVQWDTTTIRIATLLIISNP
jgi:hypothetical protein